MILLKRAFDDPTVSWRDMREAWVAPVCLLLFVSALLVAIAGTLV